MFCCFRPTEARSDSSSECSPSTQSINTLHHGPGSSTVGQAVQSIATQGLVDQAAVSAILQLSAETLNMEKAFGCVFKWAGSLPVQKFGFGLFSKDSDPALNVLKPLGSVSRACAHMFRNEVQGVKIDLGCFDPQCNDRASVIHKFNKSLSRYSNLKSLALRGSGTFTNSINVWDTFVRNNDPAGMSLLEGLSNLQHLDLSRYSRHDDVGGLNCLTELTNLQSLRLDLLSKTDVRGSVVLTQLPNLEHLALGIRNYCGVADNILTHLNRLSKLKHLTVNFSGGCNDLDMSYLKELKSLKYLNLNFLGNEFHGRPITDRGIADLAKLTQLEHLTLSHSVFVNADQSLIHLQKLTNLRILNLTGLCVLRGEFLVHLKALSNLQHLALPCHYQFADESLAHLKGFDNLQHLNLSFNPKLTDKGLAYLEELPTLRSLKLAWNNKITDEGLIHIGQLPNLQRLNLAHLFISDHGLTHLKTLTQLQHLTLEGRWHSVRDESRPQVSLKYLSHSQLGRITDNGVATLKELINLRSLSLAGCRRITDQSLAHLGEFTNLEELDLSGCPHITSEGLNHLSRIKNLRYLGLYECENISFEKAARFCDELGICVIGHTGGMLGKQFFKKPPILWSTRDDSHLS